MVSAVGTGTEHSPIMLPVGLDSWSPASKECGLPSLFALEIYLKEKKKQLLQALFTGLSPPSGTVDLVFGLFLHSCIC